MSCCRDREANDAVFRLTLSVLQVLTGEDIWMPVTYFELWLTRLVGFLPELTECVVCGLNLNGSRAYFHALADGLMCADDKRLASSEISSESRMLAAKMFRAPVESCTEVPWPKAQGADLRKFLIQILQRHLEKKLVTAGMLEKADFVVRYVPRRSNARKTTRDCRTPEFWFNRHADR